VTGRGGTQAFLWPEELFSEAGAGEAVWWSCICSRPRWEKKLARWLQGRQIAHFLPVVYRETSSGRKRRLSAVPLMPGYLFLRGEVQKRDLAASGMVVRVLQPRSRAEANTLHRQLWSLWLALRHGSLLEAVARPMRPGDPVRVIGGPLRGAEGRFEGPGRHGRLLLTVDLVQQAVRVEVTPDDLEPLPNRE
jgi:transcription antitermination factor NusG